MDYVEVWGLGTGLSVISDMTFTEGYSIILERVINWNSDSMIVRKPWITYNHAKIAELTPGDSHMGNEFA